jgi:hypothetical protein
MYNFKKFEPSPLGRKALNALTVSGKSIRIFGGYTKDFKDYLYAEVFYDKKNEVVGVKPSKAKIGFHLGKTLVNGLWSLGSGNFLEIPDGRYIWFERTKENVDVFKIQVLKINK